MKANPWLLPGAALLVTGGWIISKKNSSATLQREITVLTERIQQAKSLEDEDPAAREAAETAGREKEKAIDWKDIGVKMAQARGDDMRDMLTVMRLQRLLFDMSTEELCAKLDEIAGLDIDDKARKMLQGRIIEALAERDPKLALERFGDLMMEDSSGISSQLGSALRRWADSEPGAAAAWLDRQISAGKLESKSLDGKNEALIRFERPLVFALMNTDIAAATARVEALPTEQRGELFQRGYIFHVPAENEGAFVTLVRESMPADKVAGILADKAGTLAIQGGYDRVDDFIDRANANSDEKAAIVRAAMEQKLVGNGGGLDEASIDGARTWAASQAPATVDSAIGGILGNALLSSGDFDKVSSLAVKYNEVGGNDDVLAAFLKSGAVRNNSPEKAKALISQIADPALREEISALPEYQKLSSEP